MEPPSTTWKATSTARLAEFEFKPAKAHSANAGAIYVTEGGEYLGKIVGGRFQRVYNCNPNKEAAVVAVASDPEAAAIAFGKKWGKCSVCARDLSDEKSIARGIGPICAERMGW